MKTSTKIIISFLAFAWLALMVTLLISFKYSDQRDYGLVSKIEKEDALLEEFEHVVIKNSGDLTITSSDSLILTYHKYFFDDGEIPEEPELSYRVSNDTLFIDRLMQRSTGYYELKVKDLKNILLEDVAEVNFRRFKQDSLTVISNEADLNFLDSMDVGIDEVNSRYLDVNLSYLDYTGNFSRLKADKVNYYHIRLVDSQADLEGRIDSIGGIVGARSFLMLPKKIGKINLDPEGAGKIQMR